MRSMTTVVMVVPSPALYTRYRANFMGDPGAPTFRNALVRLKAGVAGTLAFRADLARVTVPTLILQCSKDVIAPPEVGAYVQAHIPGSTLVTLPATGHCPHLSAPAATLEAIRSFVCSPR